MFSKEVDLAVKELSVLASQELLAKELKSSSVSHQFSNLKDCLGFNKVTISGNQNRSMVTKNNGKIEDLSVREMSTPIRVN